jgi:hypothetical protein
MRVVDKGDGRQVLTDMDRYTHSVTQERHAEGWALGEKGLPKRRLPLIPYLVIVALAGGVIATLAIRSGESSPGASAPISTPMSLALSFREEQTDVYFLDVSMKAKMKTQGSIVPMQLDFQQRLSGRVLSVDQSGVATVRMTVKTLSATADAQPVPPSALPVCRTTLRVAPDGRILGSSGLPPGSYPDGLPSITSFDQLTPLLPDQPVAIGDSWSKSYEQPWPLGDGSLRVNSASSLVGHQQVGSMQTAVIETTWTMPLDLSVDIRKVAKALGESDLGFPIDRDAKLLYTGELKFNETSWFNPADGRLVSSSGGGRFSITLRPTGFSSESGFPSHEFRMNGRMTVNTSLRPQAANAAVGEN